LINQENKRLGGARNTGIEATDSELIAFLDADDVWYPGKLSAVVSCMNALSNEVGLVCHDELAVGKGFKQRLLRYGPCVPNMYERLLFGGNCLSPSAVTIRRHTLGRLRFSEDSGFHSIEDYDLWLRLARVTRFHFLHQVLGEYRLYPHSLSTDVNYNLVNTLNVLESHFQAYFGAKEMSLVQRWRKRRRVAVVYRQASKRSFDARNLPLAKKYFSVAVRQSPLSLKCWALGALIASRMLVSLTYSKKGISSPC
jgi:glycosyltransferase involved in cell wall biosynthesis